MEFHKTQNCINIKQFLNQESKEFNNSFTRLDLELLIAKTLHCSREKLYTLWDKVLSSQQVQQIKSLFNKKKQGWPTAYLIGEKEFYSLVFKIKSPIFIPRPDTETLVSAVLLKKKKNEKLAIMDLGSGSGCVGLSLLKYFPQAKLIAVDKDLEAIKLSRLNARRLGLDHRCCFLNKEVAGLEKSDYKEFTHQKLDLITANPPYISFNDPHLQKETAKFESPLALFSGSKGFEHIYSWLNTAEKLLSSGGQYFFEVGIGQAQKFPIGKKIKSMYCVNHFKDLSETPRVIQFQKI